MLQAITGKHPLGWLQSVLAQMGGQRWLDAAAAAGIPTRALEDLTSRWQRLGPQEQAALFRAAGQSDWLQLIREWSQKIANEVKGQAALHQAVSEWPWHEDEASRVLLDWLNSAAGSVLDAPLSAEAFDRLLASAREVHALLDQERVVTALQKLRAKACDVALPALEGLDGLAQALGARAKTALEKAFSAELALRASRTAEDTALIDAQFEFSAAGLEAYRRTLSGDLLPALRPGTAGVQVRHALLSHHVLKRFELELHLPFVATRSWECKTDAMAQAEITTDESGRTVVVSARAQDGEEARNRYQSVLTVAGGWLKRGAEDPQVSFSLAFDDRRRVQAGDDAQPWYRILSAYRLAGQAQAWVEAAGEPVEAALTVRAPGELVAEWIGCLPSGRLHSFCSSAGPAWRCSARCETGCPPCGLQIRIATRTSARHFRCWSTRRRTHFRAGLRAQFTYDVMTRCRWSAPGVRRGESSHVCWRRSTTVWRPQAETAQPLVTNPNKLRPSCCGYSGNRGCCMHC